MWPNPQIPADLVTFTEEILNEKLHFLCSEYTPINSNLKRLEEIVWFNQRFSNRVLTEEIFTFKDLHTHIDFRYFDTA